MISTLLGSFSWAGRSNMRTFQRSRAFAGEGQDLCDLRPVTRFEANEVWVGLSSRGCNDLWLREFMEGERIPEAVEKGGSD